MGCVLAQCVDHGTHTAANSSCNACGGTAAGLSHCDLAVAQRMTQFLSLEAGR